MIPQKYKYKSKKNKEWKSRINQHISLEKNYIFSNASVWAKVILYPFTSFCQIAVGLYLLGD